jgi:hypothetical protein
MKLEQVPIVIGVIVCLIAAAIVYDAVRPDLVRPGRERRRRERAEINTPGEWLVALGTACIGASLIGRDDWRWGTIAVIAGGTFLMLGGIMNRAFLKETLLFRGAARRTQELEVPPVAKKPDNEPRLRIR